MPNDTPNFGDLLIKKMTIIGKKWETFAEKNEETSG